MDWFLQSSETRTGTLSSTRLDLLHTWSLKLKGLTRVDYMETFAPVSKFTLICVLLTITVKLNLETHQMGVKSAFLNSDLNKEIFMNWPQASIWTTKVSGGSTSEC